MDQQEKVLDFVVPRRGDTRAAKTCFRQLLKGLTYVPMPFRPLIAVSRSSAAPSRPSALCRPPDGLYRRIDQAINDGAMADRTQNDTGLDLF